MKPWIPPSTMSKRPISCTARNRSPANQEDTRTEPRQALHLQGQGGSARPVNHWVKFITGSSNLTRAGMEGQNEFNVEIGDYGTQEADNYFDNLWVTAVPITEKPDRRDDLIRFVRNRTQVAEVTPFEAYVLVLKSYLDLMEQKAIKPYVIRLLEERNYKVYKYQLDAVNQALTIIDQYNGVIIADVVGLGKISHRLHAGP